MIDWKVNRFFIFAILMVMLTGNFACSKDDAVIDEEEEMIEEPTEEPSTDSFAGPTYKDDYTGIASWNDRSKWNLANVHDPSVVKDGDYFYMYQTDASYGNAHEGNGHFPSRRSIDLVNWEYMNAVFPEAPSWIKDSLNNMRANMEPALEPIENPNYGFWAPHVNKVGSVYRLYYSVVVTNPIVGNDPNAAWTERAFIGLAESSDLSSGVWEDKGMVISSVADGVETYFRENGNDWSGYFKFNAIDPSFVITPNGEQWLIYGSWHSGISAVQIDPSTGKPFELNNLEDYGVRIAGRGNVNVNRWQALEAPEIIYNDETGYYYLFLAYDELSVAYNTRVVRSQNITGPYYGIDGGNVTEGAEAYPILTHPYKFNGHNGWVGISHPSVFQNLDTGKWFYSSQGRLPENVAGINASNAVMMGQIREIYWTEDGWPLVAPERYAGVPNTEISEDDIIGSWEEITLNYQYRSMQTSYGVIFNEDYSLGGSIDGTWSFDASSETLIINGDKFIVDNAWNWESSPRQKTLTYVGISSSGASIWAKKNN